MALLGGATATYILVADPSTDTTRIVLAAAVAVAAVFIFATVYGARSATQRVHHRLGALRSLASRGEEDMRWLVDKVQRGERPTLRGTDVIAAEGDGPFASLARDIQREQHTAQQAVLHVATLAPGGDADQRVEVFLNLARRMQSLVHREIQLLDDLEAQVEDPDLLKGLFTVDHLATRLRRQSESLAVLGGAVSRRQWTRPVSIQEVLRGAVAEVEQYSRVKVVRPADGWFHGNVVADIIHLTAELVENATKFSAPQTQVLVRAQNVTAGLAIEIEDRGLGMQPEDQRRVNGVLADPGRVDVNELLRDGRIGLYVVSTLARRHGIKVQMDTNIYGGVQAVVVLPPGLYDLAPKQQDQQDQQDTPDRQDREDRQERHERHERQERQHRPERAPRHEAPEQQPPHAPPSLVQPEPVVAAPAPRPTPSPRPIEANRTSTLPAREPGAQPHERDGAATGERPAAGLTRDLAVDPRPAGAERPRLPQRRVQTHLAPQLREAPSTRVADPTPEHTPGLMAAFQGGISRAEEEDGPGRADGTR